MTDFAYRIPCPICLGVKLTKVTIGDDGTLVLDYCTRCGGIWFDAGEVQRLARKRPEALWAEVARDIDGARPRCHACHAFIERNAETCRACGLRVELSCPVCDRTMTPTRTGGFTLDVCRPCRGVWFDHHELAGLWEIGRAAALERQRAAPAASRAGVGGDALEVLAYSPDLVFWGAYGAAHAGSAAAQGLMHVPEAVGAAAEVAGEAAASVFEVIVGIIAGIFS